MREGERERGNENKNERDKEREREKTRGRDGGVEERQGGGNEMGSKTAHTDREQIDTKSGNVVQK